MTTTIEEYKPNLNDPRVITKIRRCCGFVRTSIAKNGKDSQISNCHMTRYFGNYHNKGSLAEYLKNSFVICTDDFYSKDAGVAKSYTRNEFGYRAMCKVAFGSSRTLPDNIQEQGELELENSLNTTSTGKATSPINWSETLEVESALDFAEEHFKDSLKELDSGTIKYNLKSDRYFFSLQNILREVKKIVLARHNFTHQYDIECCAPTLLYQYAQKLGMDEYLFAISRYLNDRSECRQEVMTATGLSSTQVKKMITSLFSGAKLGANKRFTFFKSIDCNYTLMRKINEVPFIKALKSDISKLWSFFIKAGAVTRTVKTDLDTGKMRTLALTSRQKWSLYFRLERSVLDSVNRYLGTTNNKCFLEHDGWSTTSKIDQDALIAHINKDTSFNIKLSYECVSPIYTPLETLKPQPHEICTLCSTEVFADEYSLLKESKYSVFHYTVKNSRSQRLTWEEIADMDAQNKLYSKFVDAKLSSPGVVYDEKAFNIEFLDTHCELNLTK